MSLIHIMRQFLQEDHDGDVERFGLGKFNFMFL
jgi:hypothetical protein